MQVAATSSNSTGSIDIDDVAGRKLSIWDLLRFTLPTLGVWVINPILRCDISCLTFLDSSSTQTLSLHSFLGHQQLDVLILLHWISFEKAYP